MPAAAIEFSIQAEPENASTWADLARSSERLGMRALLVPERRRTPH